MTEREEALTAISDLSKDAQGFRDRSDYSDLTVEQLWAIADSYNREGWEREFDRLCYEAGVDTPWEDMQRMSTAELAHRCNNFTAPAPPTSGQGWKLEN